MTCNHIDLDMISDQDVSFGPNSESCNRENGPFLGQFHKLYVHDNDKFILIFKGLC